MSALLGVYFFMIQLMVVWVYLNLWYINRDQEHLFHSHFNSYLCVNNLKLIVTLIFLVNYLILSMSSYIIISFGMKRFFCSFIVFIIENKLVIDETKTGISLCKHVVCFCSPSCFHMTWYRNEGRERKMKMRRVCLRFLSTSLLILS